MWPRIHGCPFLPGASFMPATPHTCCEAIQVGVPVPCGHSYRWEWSTRTQVPGPCLGAVCPGGEGTGGRGVRYTELSLHHSVPLGQQKKRLTVRTRCGLELPVQTVAELRVTSVGTRQPGLSPSGPHPWGPRSAHRTLCLWVWTGSRGSPSCQRIHVSQSWSPR